MKNPLFEAIEAHPDAEDAEQSQRKILQLIRKNPSLLKEKDSDKQTPIQLLAQADLWTIVHKIAYNYHETYKYDGTDGDFCYGSALLYAIKEKETTAAITLINANASLTWSFTSTKNYAVHTASLNKNIRIFSLLIDKGANLTYTNRANKTAIHFAASSEFWEGVEYIASRKKTDEQDAMQFGWALFKAAKAGKTATVKILLQADALLPWLSGTIHLQSNKETPIEAAARLGHMDCVQLLLEFDRDLKKKSAIIESLHYEQTLLHLIAAQDCALTKFLLQRQAPCNAWNSEVGNIALHAAIQTNNDKLVKLLIEFGANPFIENKALKNSVDIADNPGQKHLIPLLLQTTCKPIAKKFQSKAKNLAHEKYQLLLDGAVLSNSMPAFLENLLQSYKEVLSEDLVHLDGKRSTSEDPAFIKSVTLLIQSIHALRNGAEDNIAVKEIITLSEKGFVEADNILHYLNRNNQIMDYAKRMKNVLTDIRIKGIAWQVSGFFGPTSGMPPQIVSIETSLTALKKANCSCQNILQISMDIIKICAVNPDKCKPENQLVIEFFNNLLRKMAQVSFENPIEKVALYPTMSTRNNNIQLVPNDNPVTPVAEKPYSLETLLPTVNTPHHLFAPPTENAGTPTKAAPTLYSSLG